MVDSLIYLMQFYWPNALGALEIGLGAGWFSYTEKK